MPFATAQKLKDLGFKTEQFGTPADFDAYLNSIITGVALEVEEEIGAAAYAAIVGATVEEHHAILAEVQKAAAELWRRRASFVDAAARTSGDEDEQTSLHDQYMKNARAAESRASSHLTKLTSGSDVGGVAVGYVQTGALSTV